MAEPGASLLPRLAGIVGEAHVHSAAPDVEPFVSDWRGRYRGRALAVVLPASTDEVSAVVQACAETGTPIVPQGGNTGLCGGAVPDESGGEVVVALRRMNRVRAVDVANATITVEAGVPLAALQAAATSAGMHFPLSLASEGSCTIGGNLSTNAGGTAVLRYGNTRELALGIEVVLGDGRVLPALRGLRKDNTGYDLKQLFIGAEGTLGIVTAAVMKLFPAPHTQATALVAVPSVEGAIALLSRLKRALSDRLVGFELMSAFALALSRKHHPGSAELLEGHPWYALVQADDSARDASLAQALETSLAEAVEAGDAVDASIAQSKAQAEKLWALRENVSEAQRREGPNIKHDISLPVSAIPIFLRESDAALLDAFPGARLVVFGHLGDGNLHYNLAGPEGSDPRHFMDNAEAANRVVHDLVARHGGSFSAEHGVGQLKRDELVRYKSPVEVAVMRAIKAALDPGGHHESGEGAVMIRGEDRPHPFPSPGGERGNSMIRYEDRPHPFPLSRRERGNSMIRYEEPRPHPFPLSRRERGNSMIRYEDRPHPFPLSRRERGAVMNRCEDRPHPFPLSRRERGDSMIRYEDRPHPFPLSRRERGNSMIRYEDRPHPFPLSRQERGNVVARVAGHSRS